MLVQSPVTTSLNTILSLILTISLKSIDRNICFSSIRLISSLPSYLATIIFKPFYHSIIKCIVLQLVPHFLNNLSLMFPGICGIFIISIFSATTGWDTYINIIYSKTILIYTCLKFILIYRTDVNCYSCIASLINSIAGVLFEEFIRPWMPQSTNELACCKIMKVSTTTTYCSSCFWIYNSS